MEQDHDCVCEPARPLQATANATANRMLDEDRQCHDWYRFVLSFPPHLVREYIDRFGLTSRDRVLDPFCGTGTDRFWINIDEQPQTWYCRQCKKGGDAMQFIAEREHLDRHTLDGRRSLR